MQINLAIHASEQCHHVVYSADCKKNKMLATFAQKGTQNGFFIKTKILPAMPWC